MEGRGRRSQRLLLLNEPKHAGPAESAGGQGKPSSVMPRADKPSPPGRETPALLAAVLPLEKINTLKKKKDLSSVLGNSWYSTPKRSRKTKKPSGRHHIVPAPNSILAQLSDACVHVLTCVPRRTQEHTSSYVYAFTVPPFHTHPHTYLHTYRHMPSHVCAHTHPHTRTQLCTLV